MPKVEKECAICNDTFILYDCPSNAGIDKIYCSNRCRGIGISKRSRKHKWGLLRPKFINWQGYVMVWKRNHPHKNYQGYVREHRLVMEKSLGRFLEKEEVIHHINGNRQDNDLSNLLLTSKSDHAKLEYQEGKLAIGIYQPKLNHRNGSNTQV